MSGCAACGTWCSGRICDRCGATLQRGPTFVTAGGVMVTAAFRHRGAARRMVHGLKYAGLDRALAELAEAMAHLVPPCATGLVPVRRATLRKWRHGLDPGAELSRRIGRLVGLPVADVVRPGLWWPRHAGRDRGRRSAVRFVARTQAEPGWLLVDDVATTGSTLDAAAAALGGIDIRALVATAPSRVPLTLVNTDRFAAPRDHAPGLSPGADRIVRSARTREFDGRRSAPPSHSARPRR